MRDDENYQSQQPGLLSMLFLILSTNFKVFFSDRPLHFNLCIPTN